MSKSPTKDSELAEKVQSYRFYAGVEAVFSIFLYCGLLVFLYLMNCFSFSWWSSRCGQIWEYMPFWGTIFLIGINMGIVACVCSNTGKTLIIHHGFIWALVCLLGAKAVVRLTICLEIVRVGTDGQYLFLFLGPLLLFIANIYLIKISVRILRYPRVLELPKTSSPQPEWSPELKKPADEDEDDL